MVYGMSGSWRLDSLPEDCKAAIYMAAVSGVIVIGDCKGFDELVLQYLTEIGSDRNKVWVTYENDKPRIETFDFKTLRVDDKDEYILDVSDAMIFVAVRGHSKRVNMN